MTVANQGQELRALLEPFPGYVISALYERAGHLALQWPGVRLAQNPGYAVISTLRWVARSIQAGRFPSAICRDVRAMRRLLSRVWYRDAAGEISSRKRLPPVSLTVEVLDPVNDYERVEDADFLERFRGALVATGLKPAHASAILLYTQHYKSPEIAELLGLGTNACLVRQWIVRCRQLVRATARANPALFSSVLPAPDCPDDKAA